MSRTMNSSFQKSPALSEETIHLSELGHHKSQAEVRQASQSSGRSFWVKEEFDADEQEGEYDYDEKTDMPIGGTGLLTTEKKPEENNGKKILKPGEKNKIRINGMSKNYSQNCRLANFNKMGLVFFLFWLRGGGLSNGDNV